MKSGRISGMAVAVALIAGGVGACGEDDPAAPSSPSQSPVESSAKPGTKSQEPTRSPDPAPQDTDERPLPEECKHPAGASVRESCIEEYGPDGVGTVEPVPTERDQNDNGVDNSVEESEPSQDKEPTAEPEPTQDEELSAEPEPSQDGGRTGEQEPSEEGEPTAEPGPPRGEEQVPPKEEQIEQCIEQTGMPEECREKIDP